MPRVRTPYFALFVLLFAVTWGAQTLAQQVKEAPAAPLPSQLLTARKVFIGNAGVDRNIHLPKAIEWRTGNPGQTYNSFYAAIKNSGLYEITDAPATADLVFELSFSDPVIYEGHVPDFDPQFRLTIVDPKTNVVLWTLIQHVDWAMKQSNRDKNFDEAMATLFSNLKKLTRQSSAATPNPKN